MESWESEYNRSLVEAVSQFRRGPVKDLIIYMINQLIIGQMPRDKISMKLKADLRDEEGVPLVSDRWIEKVVAQVMNDNGDTIVITKAVEPKDPNLPDREKFIRKFKESPNGPENLPYVEHLLDVKEFLEQVMEKLRNRSFLGVLSKDAEALKDYSEFITVSKESIDLARQEWDDRNTVPVQKQFKLLELVTGSTIKHGAKTYLAYAKEQAKISSKQVTKILYGRVRDIDKMYEPNSKEDAKESGYSGVQCTSCDSWRVRLEHGWAKCFACENEFESKPLPLGKFKEEDQE